MRDIPATPCLGLIHTFEKGPVGTFAATPYKDPAGYWTNGWGHRCAQDAPAINQQQADQQALNDLAIAAQGVCDALGDVVTTLTDGQYAALIDFTYNVGVGAFTDSTLCRLVKGGAFHLVPDEFRKWIYGTVGGHKVVLNGLPARRSAEVDVWNT